MKKPNILLIMADQLAPQFTGAYGHPVVKTPHMDALVESGTRFDAAYCNSPLCAPARFSMMSGQLISKIAAYDNASEFHSSVPTFAHYLRSAGYQTCLSGKMHFVGPDQLHGFINRLTTDVYPSDYAWTPDWEQPDERIDKWYHNMDSVREAGAAATTFQIEYDDEVCFFARRQIFEYRMNRQTPFMMVASFIHPHDPYVARPEWWNLYKEDEIDLPQTTLTDDPHTVRVWRAIQADTEHVTEQEVRNARRAYYANTSYFDSKIGVLVNALKEADLYDDTLIIITSDHGDMLGERGLWYKMNFFEHSMRVPMIISGPGVQSGVSAAPVSHIDVLPTMLEAAGIKVDQTQAPGAQLDGQSLWPLLQGGELETTVIGEYCAEMTGHPMFMIRRGDYKYIHCDTDPAQLFNVKKDPFERTNLVADAGHAELAAAFAAEVAERWNGEQLRDDVLRTQKSRRAIYQSMQAAYEAGHLISWDYQPKRDAAQEYVRNHMDWTVAAETKRYPLHDASKPK